MATIVVDKRDGQSQFATDSGDDLGEQELTRASDLDVQALSQVFLLVDQRGLWSLHNYDVAVIQLVVLRTCMIWLLSYNTRARSR